MLPNEGPAWRTPNVLLLANGIAVLGVTEAEVISTNCYAADSFQICLALGADPTCTASFWASTSDISVDLQFSADGISFTSIVQGKIDTVLLDPIVGTARLEGRDLTAGLIESRIQEIFSNRTASEIATILAQRHGLAPIVTPTFTPIGRYYENEHDRVTLSQFTRASTEWDLLVLLARQEGYDVFVEGSSLFFQPASIGNIATLVLDTSSLMSLQMRRYLTLARDLEVTVRSWSSRNQSTCVQTVSSTMQGAIAQAVNSDSTQRFLFVHPNLTPDQALQYAQQRVAELVAHERVFDATMPGELSLTARSMVGLTGTGTDFDQSYYVDTIERRFDIRNGFTQRIRCKNTSPRTLSVSSTEPSNGTTGP